MAEYNKVYASLKPELPKVIQQEQIYVYAPKSSRAGMKSITGFNITAPVASVQYDTTDGITVNGNSSLVSEEVSGETMTQNFQSEFKIPIRPGKYIGIDATADNDAVEVKIDDTALALDYFKIDKRPQTDMSAPVYVPNSGTSSMYVTSNVISNSIAKRDSNGNCQFQAVYNNLLVGKDATYMQANMNEVYRTCRTAGTDQVFTKNPTDTGTISADLLAVFTGTPNSHIIYDNQLYYCMDPRNAPNGTLNFIHLDSIDDGNGGYKATGKCLSVTVSTRAWKVFDLDFGSSGSGNGIDSIETLDLAHEVYSGDIYGTEDGQIYNAKSTIKYRDAETNKFVDKVFHSTVHIPIVGSDYINIAGDAANSRFVLKLDDEKMSQDYIKIDKTSFNYLPWWYDGTLKQLSASTDPDGGLLAIRLPNGQMRMTECMSDTFSTTAGNDKVDFYAIYNNTVGTEYSIDKTSTDTGTLTTTQLSQLYGTVQSNNRRIIYDGQAYIRMDPTNAPNGTLNFIHLDSIDDGNGGYKATGKCLSVTVSTRAWQVFDLDFGGSTRTTHNLTLTYSSTGMSIYFSLTNNRTETYEGAPAGLLAALENNPIACTVDNNGKYAAGIITVDGDNFKVTGGEGEELLMTQEQVAITDSLV